MIGLASTPLPSTYPRALDAESYFEPLLRRLPVRFSTWTSHGTPIKKSEAISAHTVPSARLSLTATLIPGAALATDPNWSPHTDFLVGPEKNAISDYEIVPMQLAQPGKIDVNNAVITEYKRLPGMYPRAAGLIASNGPYKSVKDLTSLPMANEHDKELFRKYANELVAMPPGRQFYERINSRQST